MLTVFAQKFNEQRNSIIYYLAGLIGYALLMISMFPSMQKANLEEITKNMPEEMMKFFGGDAMSLYSTIEGFLSMEYLSFFFILIISFYIGSAAGSSVAGGIEKHTLDFDLSQPITRTKFFLGNVSIAIINILILVWGTAFSIYLLCKAYDVDISSQGIIVFATVASLFNLAIFGYAIFFSSVFRSKLSVVLSTVVLTLAFYVFFSLTNIIDKIKDYDQFSLFYLYDPQKLLANHQINADHIIILGLVFLIGNLTALYIFNKKDI